MVVQEIASDPPPRASGVPPAWVDTWAERGTHDIYLVYAGPRSLTSPVDNDLPRKTHVLVLTIPWKDIGGSSSASGGVPRWATRLVDRYREVTVGERQVIVLYGSGMRRGMEGVVRALLERPSNAVREVLAYSPEGNGVEEVWGRVAAVVLAAGAGKRFGGPKQVVEWRGRPLIWHVLDAVAGSEVNEIVVVMGAHRNRVEEVVRRWQDGNPDSPPLRLVYAPDWHEGQSRSVRAGVEALPPVHGALFPLADQPRISPALINVLMAEHRRTLAGIVVPTYGGRPGAPVLFDRRFFGALRQLEGDAGGRQLVRAHPEAVVRVPWPDVSAGWDVDTREMLHTYEEETGS